ncbi:MAG TPA: hypothetical protein VK074_05895 [Fodinibius sp.]|nr:hypothetical protein [Fodinibius sp.]
MNRLKIIFFLACTIVAMVGCLDNTGSDPEPITEPMGISYYYIVNQSGLDLNVTYEIAFSDIDSTVAVSADSTTKIFEEGGIGGLFPPSHVLTKLSFYKSSDDSTSPILTIAPVVNENWNLTAGEVDNVAKYELVLSTEDLK